MQAPTGEPQAKAEATGEGKKKPKKYGFLLVSVPGWPKSDPGRKMLFRVYPTALKAERKAKRMKRRHPMFDWYGEELTMAEAQALKLKPFRIEELGVEVRPTAHGVRVVQVDGKR